METELSTEDRAALLDEGYAGKVEEAEEVQDTATDDVPENDTEEFSAEQDDDSGNVDTDEEEQRQEEPAVDSKVVFDSYEYRVKQLERRVGSLQGELSKYKQREASQPQPQQEDDDDFAEDYPAQAKILKEQREIINQMRDRLQRPPDDGQGNDVAQMQIEAVALTQSHPDWQAIAKTPEWKAFATTSAPEIRMLAGSDRASDVSAALDIFKKTRAKQQGKQQRLASAADVSRRSQPQRAKSEANMSPGELRAHLLKKGYDEVE